MKVLLTGASGFVGSALTASLRADGHTAIALPRLAGEGAQPDHVPDLLEGADAVVNLAGASIAGGRWTSKRKALLFSSRVDTTRALVSALASTKSRPKVLVSASAMGYYGNRGDEILTEESKPGSDFLAEITRAWEAEGIKAEGLGIRVVLPRFGIVLGKEGGPLPQMMLPFRFGVGGRVGSGKQWMSWITLADAVGFLRYALADTTVKGPFNVVAPGPVQNAEFTRALAAAMHRPAIFPVPAFALRLMLGEMADALLLVSLRVLPSRLQQLDYKFTQPEIFSALKSTLG
jgi:uncharacterized protein (TIGR01777 family)